MVKSWNITRILEHEVFLALVRRHEAQWRHDVLTLLLLSGTVSIMVPRTEARDKNGALSLTKQMRIP
jgi:hypothetical protein